VQSSNPRFLEILKVLTQHRVDFIVVGGVSAVLNGAPVTKSDLAVVHARNLDNIARGLAALWIVPGSVEAVGKSLTASCVGKSGNWDWRECEAASPGWLGN
jgi:hypothetical protein